MPQTTKKTPELTLHSLIEEAIKMGADSIEFEYVPEGLEITFFLDDIGTGKVIRDRTSIEAIFDELVSTAKLEKKTRGVFKWGHPNPEYEIHAQEYQSFGESAFRLTFKIIKKLDKFSRSARQSLA